MKRISNDVNTSDNLQIKSGKYGHYVNYNDKNISLTKYLTFTKKKLKDITIEDVEYLGNFPKRLGIFKKEDVILRFGEYGEYIHYAGKFFNIPKGGDPVKDYLSIIGL